MKVLWDDKKCSHSGNCVKTLPEVYMIKDGAFVIEPQNASDEKVRQSVAACPSHALSIEPTGSTAGA